MNANESFIHAIEAICCADDRYDMEAYLFVREGLEVTSKMLEKPRKGAARHVTGRELLEGLRIHALQEFGPMSRTVLESWGIQATEDFGHIVFNLVEGGVLGKTESDTLEDFKAGYDFEEAFVLPFLPDSAKPEDGLGRGNSTTARGKGHGSNTTTGESS